MKRFFFLLALCAMASPAWAVATFTPTTADLLLFQPLGAFSTEASFTNFGVFTTPGTAYSSPMLLGDVGYSATDVGGVGALEYVGVGKAGFDLTGFDTFQLVIYNDDNQDWMYRLFASDGDTTNKSGSWVEIEKEGGSRSLSVSLAGLDLTDVTIGFKVGRSDQPDNFHTSVSPVPVPGAILLGSIGLGMIGWLRRRHAL